eukprot:CAMPEP_0119342158 /NCGR_PEP_ID=MMETSP1333-20130426/104135_1 /TAXON_ID=418940 /ORGANISM="Scyphosphaera apsteinii, Strain RCC1455" /LENGTH=70 /DNA_ID=CAMNT_0007354321 /DNA_START=712 /DNA_END=924 /DNA_ORIENTATION=-
MQLTAVAYRTTEDDTNCFEQPGLGSQQARGHRAGVQLQTERLRVPHSFLDHAFRENAEPNTGEALRLSPS